MEIRDITEKDKEAFNALATHPLQSYEWGEFREATGIKVIRKGFFENNKLTAAFQLTIHPIPHTKWSIGYLPKGSLPTKELLEELTKIGKEHNCIFIQLEPNIVKNKELGMRNNANKTFEQFSSIIHESAHPLFTRYTLHLDLTKSEDDLLKAMHPKARYNIKVAQKHGIDIMEDNSQEAFEEYWKLTQETTKRQGFFAHTKKYHQMMFGLLCQDSSAMPQNDRNKLSAHLLLAKYQISRILSLPKGPNTKYQKVLTAWIVFVYKDTLYYPYGASSQEHRETMHSTLMMWEAIRFGKQHNLKTFDLWGAASPDATSSDPWFGFTQFKERFGPMRIELVGSYDLVIYPLLYEGYKLADKLRWLLLKLKK